MEMGTGKQGDGADLKWPGVYQEERLTELS